MATGAPGRYHLRMDPKSKDDVLVVLTTVANLEEAKSLAHAVVEKGNAACVNILPEIRSIYSWEGRICDDPEVLLVIKTNRRAFAALSNTIGELHSYDVPEIVALPTDAVDPRYAAWLSSAVQNQPRP